MGKTVVNRDPGLETGSFAIFLAFIGALTLFSVYTGAAAGTPVHRMHRHCEVPVYTFAALQCALDRLPPGDWPLVVIAHPRHLPRIRMGLSALAADRKIVYISSGPACSLPIPAAPRPRGLTPSKSKPGQIGSFQIALFVVCWGSGRKQSQADRHSYFFPSLRKESQNVTSIHSGTGI